MTHLKQVELERDAEIRHDPLLKLAVDIDGRFDRIHALGVLFAEETDFHARSRFKKEIAKAKEDIHQLCERWRASKGKQDERPDQRRPPPASTDNRDRDRDEPPKNVRPPVGHTSFRIQPTDVNPPPRKPYIHNSNEKGACLAVPLMCNGCNVHTTYLYEINVHNEPHASTRGTWSPTFMFDPAYMVCSTCKRGPKRD
jgi:hypothetical protein